MADFQLTTNLTLRSTRCPRCGKFYALEACEPGECPYCRSRYVGDLERELSKAKHANAALRGALKRGRNG